MPGKRGVSGLAAKDFSSLPLFNGEIHQLHQDRFQQSCHSNTLQKKGNTQIQMILQLSARKLLESELRMVKISEGTVK